MCKVALTAWPARAFLGMALLISLKAAAQDTTSVKNNHLLTREIGNPQGLGYTFKHRVDEHLWWHAGLTHLVAEHQWNRLGSGLPTNLHGLLGVESGVEWRFPFMKRFMIFHGPTLGALAHRTVNRREMGAQLQTATTQGVFLSGCWTLGGMARLTRHLSLSVQVNIGASAAYIHAGTHTGAASDNWGFVFGSTGGIARAGVVFTP